MRSAGDEERNDLEELNGCSHGRGWIIFLLKPPREKRISSIAKGSYVTVRKFGFFRYGKTKNSG